MEIDERALFEALRAEGHAVEMAGTLCMWVGWRSVLQGPVGQPPAVRIPGVDDGTKIGTAHSVADVVRLLAPYAPKAESVTGGAAEEDDDDEIARGCTAAEVRAGLGAPLDHVQGAVRAGTSWFPVTAIAAWGNGPGEDGATPGVWVEHAAGSVFEPGTTAEEFARRYGAAMGEP